MVGACRLACQLVHSPCMDAHLRAPAPPPPADGYCNSRVAWFNGNGTWLKDLVLPKHMDQMAVPHRRAPCACVFFLLDVGEGFPAQTRCQPCGTVDAMPALGT